MRERGADGRLTTVATFVDGQQIVNKVTYFPGTNKKKSEGNYLTSVATETSPDDFWRLRFAAYKTEGVGQRHGAWQSWYSGGQVALQGTYQLDRENGAFTWWHANGQKAIEGEFVDGQKDGAWVWWHANGQKATAGTYRYGKLVGSWRGWGEDGRLVQRDEYGDLATDPPQQARQIVPLTAEAGLAR